MNIVEVNDRATRKAFLDLPRRLYKDDPNWVCPLDNDIEAVFDPNLNNFFEHGKAIRWILRDDAGNTIGRIGAFINDLKAHKYAVPTGGCGFFECIDDQQAANLLFDTAKKWLHEHGMQAMEGPINFGENDMWWGLLVEGFVFPYYGMNYNHAYYQTLFEKYGFEKSYEQISNKVDLLVPFPDRFYKIAKWVSQKPGYRFESLDTHQFDKYANDFMEIYNDAWEGFDGFTPITAATTRESFRKMKPIMEPRMIWFAYVNDEPASLLVCVPDANELIRGLNGKLNLLGKLKFLYNKHIVKNTRMRAIVFGTKKKFQKHGLESATFISIGGYVLPLNRYTELELSWVGDFNKEMISIHEATGAKFSKRHITYVYKF